MAAPAFAPIVGTPPSIEWQPAAALLVDGSYQRPTDGASSRRAIAAIAAAWDWRLCEPLIVSRRLPEGRLYVVDGQHRRDAAVMRGDVPFLPCSITTFASAAEEAQVFTAANRGRRPITRFDDHRAAVAAGDADAVAVDRAIRDAGLAVASNGKASSWKPGEIGCIAGVRTALRLHGADAVAAALATYGEAYAGSVLTHAGTLLGALYPIFAHPPEGFDPDRLFTVLDRRTQAEWVATIDGGTNAGGQGHGQLRATLLAACAAPDPASGGQGVPA